MNTIDASGCAERTFGREPDPLTCVTIGSGAFVTTVCVRAIWNHDIGLSCNNTYISMGAMKAVLASLKDPQMPGWTRSPPELGELRRLVHPSGAWILDSRPLYFFLGRGSVTALCCLPRVCDLLTAILAHVPDRGKILRLTMRFEEPGWYEPVDWLWPPSKAARRRRRRTRQKQAVLVK